MFNEVLSYLILTDLPQLGMPKSDRDFLSQAAEFGIMWDVFHGGPMDLAVPRKSWNVAWRRHATVDRC